MAIVEVTFYAKSLGAQTAVNVLAPEKPRGPLPVFYLLHGLGDDHASWARRTGIERYMQGVPMIVVMPANARGWYTNSATNLPNRNYEDLIIKELVPFIDRTFPTKARREGRVIGGLSMGGYGAVKLALKFPDMFCSAASLSGAVMTPLHKPETRPKELQPATPEFQAHFGPNWRGGPNDPVALAKKCPLQLRPALYMDCGTSDFLFEQNREFHTYLQSLGYPHEYHEFPGDHNWAYWDAHIQDAIAFHRRVLHI